jgi:hypothetical protein
MKKVIAASLITLLSGCSVLDEHRIAFCDDDGIEIPNTFFSSENGTMVFGDVLLAGTLNCDGSELCFDLEQNAFLVSSMSGKSASRQMSFQWGRPVWVLDVRTSIIRYEEEDFIVWSCEAVAIQQAT